MKECSKCHDAKPLEMFPRDKSRKSGRHSVCVVCKRKYNALYRQKNRIILVLKSREYSKSHAAQLAQYQRDYRKNNPLKAKELKLKSIAKNKEAYRARQIVRMRVYRGTMQKLPCQVCGDPNTQAHHSDYSKPLEVLWLCHKHHQQLHRTV